MSGGPGIADINAALAPWIADIARELAGAAPSGRSRDALRFRGRGSLSVIVAGPERGRWYDHEAGIGGDPLGLIAHLRQCPMRDALDWARRWTGGAVAPRVEPPEPARPAPDTAALARALWQEAAPARGTAVEAYLRGRGLHLPGDAPIRFHGHCPRGRERLPAMLALMSDARSAEPCGVHRTFLAPDGDGKAPGQAKMMAGRAGVIRLVPDEDVTHGLGIAEGIETSLAVMQRLDWRPVWAATSAGAIARFPVLPGVEALTIFADRDGAGLAAAQACAGRWRAAGAEARVMAPPAGDFDDMTRGGAA